MKNNNDNHQDLDRQEAIDKLKELVKHNSMCLFTTGLTELPLQTRPMSVSKVCDQGNFWFLSPKGSDKNNDIALDPRVQLFFSNSSDSEFLSVYGKAEILTNKEKIKELWTPIAKAWFTQGEDDPRITVIKVTPEDAQYWDTKNGKVVSLIKIATAVVTGHTMDGGVEGKLYVN